MKNRGGRIVTLALFIFVLALFGAPVEAAPSTGSKIKATALLNLLTVKSEQNSYSYDRALFRHWSDFDSDGCDTRAEVLMIETSKRVTYTSSSGCTVDTGKWFSVYDNVSITDAGTLDIDHFVPLKEAWESGASKWTSSQREAYANDLSFGPSLIAVTASTNRSKSDRDPASWMPPSNGFHCTYAKDWIRVKYRWHMSVDSSEKSALNRELSTCSNKYTKVPPRMKVKMTGGSSGGSDSGSNNGGGSNNSSLPDSVRYCYEAKALGFGPFYKGRDPEYSRFTDTDHDGVVCE
ncbi:MAG: hypothetical protein RLZZ330_107 [Actinomycetota bacterium]|jgi:hypothetical protein